jgi:hypothetical protein
MNLFNQLACRKLGWSEYNLVAEIFRNKWFLFVVAAEAAAQWFIVEYFNNVFRTAHLSWQMHITCVSFGIGAVLVNLATKKITEDKDKFHKYFVLNFNETNDASSGNAVFNFADGLTAKIQKSETQRIMDSNASFTSA